LAKNGEFNFDSPTSIDFELIIKTLHDLKKGKSVRIPNYSFITNKRLNEETYLKGANVVIFEGLFVLGIKELRDIFDIKIFVDEDADIRLARRIKRDMKERKRDIDGIIIQYLKFVKPSFGTLFFI
jgi:uridine kinase